jgi:hypothetical protein
MFPSILTKWTEKEKKRTRILVKCEVCCEFEEEAKRVSISNSLPFASSLGVRVEGRQGAERLTDHLTGKPHAAALCAKKLKEQFENQSDKHPWLKLFKNFRTQEVSHLIRLAMDCYNDALCETVSGFSWPSRNTTAGGEIFSRLGCSASEF